MAVPLSKVLSRPGPCDGPDPRLMFKFKSRVGYIPSSYLSGQVRLPPGGTFRHSHAHNTPHTSERELILDWQGDLAAL